MNGLRSRSRPDHLEEDAVCFTSLAYKEGGEPGEGGGVSYAGNKECQEFTECLDDLVVALGTKPGRPRMKGSSGMESDKGLLVPVRKKDGRGRPRKNQGSRDGETDKDLLVSVRKKDGRGRPRKNQGCRDGATDKDLLVSVRKKDGRGRPRKNEGSRGGETDKNLLLSVKKKDGRGRPRKNEGSRDGETDKNLLLSVRKKDGRGRPRKNEGCRDGETDKNLLVSVERKLGRPRKSEGNRDGESDVNMLVSVPKKLGRPRKNVESSDRKSDEDLFVSVVRNAGRPRKNEESSDRKSDEDLFVSVVRKAGRPRKNEGGSDSVVVEKGIIGSTKRKRKSEVEKIENKRSCLTYEDLLVSVQRKVGRPRKDYGSSDYKIEGHRGVDDERKPSKTVKKSSSPVKTNREDSVHVNKKDEIEDKQIHSAVTLEEKSKIYSKNRIIRKGEICDALVPDDTNNVERSEKASDHKKEDENTSSRSADCPIGKRTRSSVKPKNNLESPQSLPMVEEITSAKRNKHHHLRKIKDTSLQLGLEGLHPCISEKEERNIGWATSAAELCLETEIPKKKFPKKRKRSVIKQLVSDKIKSMVENAGWKIDYRPRAGRDYSDAVYVDHEGTAYWSVLRAYYALQKQYGNKESDQKCCEASFLFTPIPEELLSILKRQRRTKEMITEEKMKKGMTEKGKKKVKVTTGTESADKEQAKKRKGDNMNIVKLSGLIRHKGKSLKVRLTKKGFKLDKKIGHRRPNSHKAGNNKQNPMPKSSEANNASFPSKGQLQARKSKTQRGYTLLARNSDQEVNSSGDNFIAYAGRRTILSWLIDSEIVSLGEKVKYMDKTHRQALLEGSITRDGINCGCCSEIVTIREFEVHAGSKFCQPCQNIFVETGITLFQCQIDACNKQEESERSGYHCIGISSDDPNDDTCGICGDGGDLICCDGCPSTFHQSCLGIQVLPKGDWHCFNCCCKFCGVVGSSGDQEDDVTTSSLLTCILCEEKYHGSCILQTNPVPVASDVLSTFCGQKCRELYEKLQKLLGVKHELESGFSWTLIQRSDLESEESLRELSSKVECNSKLALALSIMDECFLPTIDERSGINLIHNVVYNCGSNFNRLNYGGFYTFLLERGDEMISAASIRIHGTRFAEMPFIGTRYMYRRQGMCRRLLNAIELSLSYLNVEKLIIPAISELLDTWTNVFGFCPLEETFKHELKSLNVLVFPGVALLQKLPLKHNLAEITFTVSSALNATGLESDNRITSEATDNVDTDVVEPYDLASDVTIAHHTNGIFEKPFIAGTGLPGMDGLVQDASDASNPSDLPGEHISQEQGSACYNFQMNESISETNSILSEAAGKNPTMNCSVKSDIRASLKALEDVPTKVNVKADGVEYDKANGVKSDIRFLTESSSQYTKDGVAEDLDLQVLEGVVEAKSPSQDESFTYTTETNTLLQHSHVESSHDFVGGSVNDGETKISARNTTDVFNASLSTVSDSVCFGSNPKFNSVSVPQYIEFESKPLEVSPEELHATYCEESTLDSSDQAIKHAKVKGDATSIQGITTNVIFHDSEDSKQPRKTVFKCNLEDGLESRAFESLQKTESDSNASGTEDSFFDAADSFHVVGNKVAVTERNCKSLDGDSVVSNIKVSQNVLATCTKGEVSHDPDRNVLPQAFLHDSPDIVVKSISQVSNGFCFTSKHLLSVPGYTCDTAADTSTETKGTGNHSVVLNLQESGERDDHRLS